MSVEELSSLHIRYIDLSDRFKAAWTFHQFLQGVNKVFANHGIGGSGVAFQGIYSELKSVSKHLHAGSADETGEQLEAIATKLEDRIGELLLADAKIDPSLMRQFFDRVKRYDARILVQLLKFYLYTRVDEGWETDRLDKADFLLTHLGHTLVEPDKAAIERQPRLLKDSLAGLWHAIGTEPPSEERIDDCLREIRTLREAMEQIQSIEQFNHLGLVQGHRKLKHGLGDHLFYPVIAQEVITNNLLLRSRIKEFYEREETRISAECQEVFELERGALQVDEALDTELQEFRGEVEEFEKKVAVRNVKLDELAHIRDRVRTLIPKLQRAGDGSPTATAARAAAERDRASDEKGDVLGDLGGEWAEGLPDTKPPGALRVRTTHADVLGDALRRLLKLLEASDWRASPRAVIQTPDALPLRLEPREVIAYRRLHYPEKFDVELERALLEAASLRIKVSAEAEEIVGMLDLLGSRREGEIFDRARQSLRLASAFELRFRHFVEQALLADDTLEARTLQLNRMRLLRDYSGLWLLVYG